MSILETLSNITGWSKVGVDKRRNIKLISTFVLWLVVGTIFYSIATQSALGSTRGYYMAVNIGYSIGFGFPEEPYTPYLLFSTVYVIIGASFVALALGHFAEMIGDDYDNWFEKLLVYEKFKESMKSGTFLRRAKCFLLHYKPQVKAVGLWVIWVSIMTTYSSLCIEGWGFSQGLYYAVSTMSTGGHYAIPNDSPSWLFGLTAFMAMLGVPIMGVAMGRIAQVMVEQDTAEEKINLLREPVTLKELEVCKQFGLEDGDGEIDRFEFIVLCTMRLGVNPNTCLFISQLFDELDKDGNGVLSVHEITQQKFRFGEKENNKSSRNLPSMSTMMTDPNFSTRKNVDQNLVDVARNQRLRRAATAMMKNRPTEKKSDLAAGVVLDAITEELSSENEVGEVVSSHSEKGVGPKARSVMVGDIETQEEQN